MFERRNEQLINLPQPLPLLQHPLPYLQCVRSDVRG
jgi:hypothetical protein